MPGVQWLKIDLTDSKALYSVMDAIGPAVVIHTAAMANIDDCERQKSLAESVNYSGTCKIAEKCHEMKSRLIFVSTDNVFDGEKGHYCEEDVPNPINYYGETKLRAEQAVSSICPDYVIARAALIYGSPRCGGSSFSKWLLMNLKGSDEVPVYIDQFRSPIYAEDLARALLELAALNCTGLFHLGGPLCLNRYEFGKILCECYGYSEKKLKKTLMDASHHDATRPRDLSFDISKCQEFLNGQPLDPYEGIARMRLEAHHN